MDMDNLRDDIRALLRGLCAKMSHLLVATGNVDLFDVE
jgi:hypothetical protein